MGTFNWHERGVPPEDAYSRFTRNLAAVTQTFGLWLDALPNRLVSDYQCRIRPGEPTDLERSDNTRSFDDAWVAEPDDPNAAPLVVARHQIGGGIGAWLGIGRAVAKLIPVCFCDACDEDGDGLIEQAEELLGVAIDGFREYRRPFPSRRGENLHKGPWLELGYEAGDRQGGTASARIVGELFDTVWGPWSRR